jgi:hypothetical protein
MKSRAKGLKTAKSLKPFKLRPNKNTKDLLELLGIDVWKDRGAITIIPRVPQGRGCSPFSPPCAGDRFFTNVPKA